LFRLTQQDIIRRARRDGYRRVNQKGTSTNAELFEVNEWLFLYANISTAPVILWKGRVYEGAA
jgi:hypothetical protein